MINRTNRPFTGLFAALSVSLLGGAAHAQSGTNTSKADRMGSMDRYMTHDYMMSDDDYSDLYNDAYPLNYPSAAPGSLNLYHYSDYNQYRLVEKDRFDASDRRERAMAARDLANRNSNYDDFYNEPAPINYPYAAPGSLSLYHFTDYNADSLSETSRLDVKEEKERRQAMRDARNRRPMSEDEEALQADPYPINYPFAAPGSLHLYHWNGYNEFNLTEGSRADVKEMQERKQAERDRRNRKPRKGEDK